MATAPFSCRLRICVGHMILKQTDAEARTQGLQVELLVATKGLPIGRTWPQTKMMLRLFPA